ncbi:hypothetical protein PR202_gb07099 [Eleusine coracana subsp. coracana]|uniref:Uncharacterized protein n=1 Tax=Eleusine coracana subsp. coracana TaxID=191504 RepID=A0AAV5EB21_ELECO|nr:hypothetical protein PR202_gb07099 [Eleusine coracana subsp. coracana]
MRWSEADVLRSKSLVKPNNFLSVLGVGSAISEQPKGREIEISETKGSSTMHLCNISLPLSVDRQRTILIFSSTLAKWHAGCVP